MFGGKWIQLFVKAPAGSDHTTPQAMKRIDDLLTQTMPASMHCPPPSGMPVQESDGTWEIRVFDESAFKIVKTFLTQEYGLEIVREVTNE